MGKFGGPSPKRHLLWSNDEMFVRQVMARGGYLSNAERDLLRTSLAKKRTQHGKSTFQGVKKKLKESQPLCCSMFLQCASFFFQLCWLAPFMFGYLRRYTAAFGHCVADVFRDRQDAALSNLDMCDVGNGSL